MTALERGQPFGMMGENSLRDPWDYLPYWRRNVVSGGGIRADAQAIVGTLKIRRSLAGPSFRVL
jgi:hypothetical protein